MDRQEFLEILQTSLAGEVSSSAIQDNVKYYNEYILGEMQKGKSEAEIMQELGEPRLIARTILDTQGLAGGDSYQEDKQRSTSYEEDYGQSESPKKGLHAEYDQEGRVNLKYGKLRLNSTLGKVLLGVCAVLALVLVFVIVNGILSLIFPILFPIIIIGFLMKILRKND